MATTTATEQHLTLSTAAPAEQKRMVVDGSDPVYHDWRDDLVRDGFAVIKGAVPKEHAATYADRMYALLESL